MSTTYPSRVTCHTFTIWDRGPRNRGQLDVQEISGVVGEVCWAIFVPGGGAWTRERGGFIASARRHLDDNMADGKKLCLWTLEEALVEAQLACAFFAAESAPMLARYDERMAEEARVAPDAIYYILSSAPEASGLTYWRRQNGGLTTFLSEAGRFTKDKTPKAGDDSGFGVLCSTAEDHAGKERQVHAIHIPALIIGNDES